jgi:16S rRNA (cytosine967-C5)-methyltransferase
MGTKTIQLWECSQPGGRVFAMDANARRCAALRQLLADRAISDIGVIEASWLKDAAAVLPKAFDRILVDAPCSNSGVLSRRAEARYAQDAETLSSLAELQARILDDTAPFVAAGGLLVYSTCSIWPEENEAVVSAFVERCRQFERERVLTTLPSVDPDATTHCDGGFVAVLRRRG